MPKTATMFGSDAYLMQPVMLTDYQLQNSSASRWARYRRYLDFYGGSQWAEQRKPGERRLTVNYARTLIHKHASYLMGKPVQFELVPNGDTPEAITEAASAEEILRHIWDDNGLALLDYDTAVDAAVLGDGAFKITRQPTDPNLLEVSSSRFQVSGSDGQPGTLNLELETSSRVVVRSVDVCNLDAGFGHSDLRELRWVTEQYLMSGESLRQQYGPEFLAAAGLTKTLLLDAAEARVIERWTAQSYEVEVNNVSVIEGPNPYGFIPYLIFPNRSVPRCAWGESDLEDIMTLASELNVRVSVLSQLLQVSGNPVLVLENVEGSDNVRVGPGAVWNLPENSKAYLLEMLKDGGVGLHIQYIELIYRMLHDLTEAPSTGFGRDNAASVHSGIALEIMLHPVLQRVARKRRIWDEILDRRNRMILRLAGLPIHRSRILWGDILPKDRAALVTQESALVASNIHSLRTARKNLGDEQPDLEDVVIAAERQMLGTENHKGIQSPRLSGAFIEGLNRSGG